MPLVPYLRVVTTRCTVALLHLTALIREMFYLILDFTPPQIHLAAPQRFPDPWVGNRSAKMQACVALTSSLTAKHSFHIDILVLTI